MDLKPLIAKQVSEALLEDVGSGDISAQLIDPAELLNTELLIREAAVLCGSEWFDEVFRQCDESISTRWLAKDGDLLNSGCIICKVSGPARGLLTAERSALNFLQTLSGTATVTRSYVEKIKHTACKILDTRKTIPQFRQAQKYAVKCGGGTNHRIGLFDAYLIKENHLAACGGIGNAVSRARELNPDSFLEIEVESLEQLQQAIDATVDRALLDNFSIKQLNQAVKINRNRIELEASGNIDNENLVEIALTGVDFISIGALTHSAPAATLSLVLRPVPPLRRRRV